MNEHFMNWVEWAAENVLKKVPSPTILDIILKNNFPEQEALAILQMARTPYVLYSVNKNIKKYQRICSVLNVQNALNFGNWASMILTVIASYFIVMWMLPDGDITLRSITFTKMGVFIAILVGTVVGAIMSIITEYYTAMGKAPVNSIIQKSSTGHATNIIGELS